MAFDLSEMSNNMKQTLTLEPFAPLLLQRTIAKEIQKYDKTENKMNYQRVIVMICELTNPK